VKRCSAVSGSVFSGRLPSTGFAFLNTENQRASASYLGKRQMFVARSETVEKAGKNRALKTSPGFRCRWILLSFLT
jgi:hypothetical protein